MSIFSKESSCVLVGAAAYDAQQRREIALKYASLPRDQRSAYARSVGVIGSTIRRWISALADGDIDNNKFPRLTGTMTHRDISEITRLKKELEAQKKKTQQLESLLARERAGADALGKAIAVLHDLNDEHAQAAKNSPKNIKPTTKNS